MARTAESAGRRLVGTRLAATPPRRRLVAGFAGLVAALISTSIAAAVTPVPVPGVPGITAPAGLARDSNGALWVADSGGGICRLLDPPFPTLNGMICPPKALQGPKSPGQMAFDPVASVFFVGDRASTGGAVWRLHLNQNVNPAIIDSVSMLRSLPTDRVLGMSYDAAEGALDFSTKDSPAIQRIANATTCVAPCFPTTVGFAVASGVLSMAHDGAGRLYLADAPGVTRIATPGVGDTQAQLIPGFDTGNYAALAFDPAADGQGRVYAGTNNSTGADWIDVLRVSDDAVVSRYSESFAGVTAIGIDTRAATHRALDVADDQSSKQFGQDTVGAGRRLTVAFELFDRPTIVAAPSPFGNSRDVTFAFTSPTVTTFWCSLDGGPAEACGAGAQSRVTYRELTDGIHAFLVQSDNPTTGGRTTRGFEIDTHAPSVTLGDVLVNQTSAQIVFALDDVAADATCVMDGGAPVPCESPVRYANLAVGDHTFSVRATDFVGNVGSPVGTTLHVAAPLVAWRPGPISATLRGRTLRVAFNAPPGARYVRFTLARKSAPPLRTTAVRVIGNRRNVVQIVLPRQMALRLQGKKFTVTIDAGATAKRFAWAGQGPLRILTALASKSGAKR